MIRNARVDDSNFPIAAVVLPTEQELVDRLVLATAEEDVLYVLLHLRAMHELGMLWRTGIANGLERPDSFTFRSALTVAATAPWSVWSETILKLFLFNLENLDQKHVREAEREWKEWARNLAERWKYKTRAASLGVLDALRLTSAEEVAEWVDNSLPLHPNHTSFTGSGPLPATLINKEMAQEAEEGGLTCPHAVSFAMPLLQSAMSLNFSLMDEVERLTKALAATGVTEASSSPFADRPPSTPIVIDHPTAEMAASIVNGLRNNPHLRKLPPEWKPPTHSANCPYSMLSKPPSVAFLAFSPKSDLLKSPVIAAPRIAPLTHSYARLKFPTHLGSLHRRAHVRRRGRRLPLFSTAQRHTPPLLHQRSTPRFDLFPPL
ncbi:hypothetical protein JCM10207_007310 [Rhodosporidiobolus poonsookiae]